MTLTTTIRVGNKAALHMESVPVSCGGKFLHVPIPGDGEPKEMELDAAQLLEFLMRSVPDIAAMWTGNVKQ